ncbi:MAG: hypothetical protein EBU01_06670 [Crocinitomicaceae bacterium]|nr:hypothetical protein [Crocinitomicaceae bacterium]
MIDVFKVKKNKESSSKSKEQFGTLDSLHEKYIKELNNKHTSFYIDEIEAKINTCKLNISKNMDIFDFDQVFRSSQLQKELKRLEDEKRDIQQGYSIENYYLQNGDIMLDYYKKPAEKQSTKIIFGMDKFSITENSGPSKRKMFDEYLIRRGLASGMTLSEAADNIKKMAEHCSDCNIAREEIHSEGILVCPKCGSEEYSLVVSDFPSFRDPPKERNNYAYKKKNHLNEILNQFQAKESTEIPEEVMNEVICEIKKRRIDNIAMLDDQNIREILKKIGRNRYYEHSAHILSRLNGNPPPTITPEIEDKIQAMFQEVQAPYLMFCPDDRRNFLSYHYIVYKFLELLELDEYKEHFPLLKSRDRLIQHDQIWKKICDYLKWEFIPST